MSARLRRAQAPPAPHLHPCPTPSRRGRWGAHQDADAGIRGCAGALPAPPPTGPHGAASPSMCVPAGPQSWEGLCRSFRWEQAASCSPRMPLQWPPFVVRQLWGHLPQAPQVHSGLDQVHEALSAGGGLTAVWKPNALSKNFPAGSASREHSSSSRGPRRSCPHSLCVLGESPFRHPEACVEFWILSRSLFLPRAVPVLPGELPPRPRRPAAQPCDRPRDPSGKVRALAAHVRTAALTAHSRPRCRLASA